MHRFTFQPPYKACQTQNWLQVKSEVELGTSGHHVLDVSKMFGQTLGVSSLHQNKYPNVCFLGSASKFKLPQFFRFLSVGTFKSSSVFSLNSKWTLS